MKTSPITDRIDVNANGGIETGLAVAVLAGIGYLLDSMLGTAPWLLVAFALLGAIGAFARLKYRYEESMSRHEAERAARLQHQRTPSGRTPPRRDGQ